MRRAWDNGRNLNEQHAGTETMDILPVGVRNGVSKEVTFKLDLNVKQQLAVTSWRKGFPDTGTANAEP